MAEKNLEHGTCSGCGADTDPDDHCCSECAEEHDEAVRAIERERIAKLVEAASIPLPIDLWRGEKRGLLKFFALALAKLIREAKP